MIRDLLGQLDYSTFAELALLSFLAIFAVVAARTFRRPADEDDRDARLPLDDAPGGNRP